MYTVYILKSQKYKKSYVGYTNDINRRLEEHNNRESNFTSKYAPWDLFYTETFVSRIEAINREKYLKSKKGRKFMKNLFDNK